MFWLLLNIHPEIRCFIALALQSSMPHYHIFSTKHVCKQSQNLKQALHCTSFRLEGKIQEQNTLVIVLDMVHEEKKKNHSMRSYNNRSANLIPLLPHFKKRKKQTQKQNPPLYISNFSQYLRGLEVRVKSHFHLCELL